jgi:hypothetical protein
VTGIRSGTYQMASFVITGIESYFLIRYFIKVALPFVNL